VKLEGSKKLYGNIVALPPHSDEPLFRTNDERAEWYVSLGLAVMEKPGLMRLTFKPKGIGHQGDPYFLQEFKNVCVVCGGTKDLSHHHVVPDCYRRHFPRAGKEQFGRWMYDVLLLCASCHERYEGTAWRFKKELHQEYGVSGSGETNLDRSMLQTIRAAAALFRHGEKMPEARRSHFEEELRKYFGYDPDKSEYFRIWKDLADEVYFIPVGQILVERHLEDVDEFAIRWRHHFLKTMKPAFMPEYWDADRRIYV
jgi:hypothetical protein